MASSSQQPQGEVGETGQQNAEEIDGASLQEIEKKQSENFRWLSRDARGPTYISYSQFSHLQACSFDWGADGYAGCCNHGGELLYLSAPSPRFGLIMARGNFSTSLYAALSRAQIEFGGPATFGFEISRACYVYDQKSAAKNDKKSRKASSFSLGRLIDRGCFNYRWPVTEYHLDQKFRDGHAEERHLGICQMFSFARNGVFYQVLRIEEGIDYDKKGNPVPKFPPDSQVLLTIGGPVYFHSFNERLHDHNLSDTLDEQDQVLDVSATHPFIGPLINTDNKILSPMVDTIRYWNVKDQIGLEAEVYQLRPDGTYWQLPMAVSDSDADSGTSYTQDDFKTKAYNVSARLPNWHENKRPRSATFVSAVRLFEGDEAGGGKWPTMPSSNSIYDYVGIRPSSPMATGAMWESTFLERQGKSDSVCAFDLAEVSLIGRSLEKILQVDIVPAIFDDETHDPPYPVPRPDGKEAFPSTPETALVSNLFVRQNIDLKSLFWKVRFLVRAYKYLARLAKTEHVTPKQIEDGGSTTNCSDGDASPHLHFLETDSGDMLNIAKFQQERIRRHIESVIRYLVKALLKPGSSTKLMPDNHIAGESNYFYVMTTIWYVTRRFPSWSWDWKGHIEKGQWNKAESHLYRKDENRIPPEDWTYGSADKDKIPLLQWYHHGSIMNLCQQKFLPETWKEAGIKWKVLRLAKEAKIASAAKLASLRPYTADDEIFDRLSFLSDELGLEHLDESCIGLVASLSMQRVKQGDNTRELNPGWVSCPENGSTSGPWEIHALCHHSRLVVIALEEKDSQDWRTKQHTKDEIVSYKRKIYRFMNAEGTLVPGWERTPEKAKKGWLRSEATAVLASTLLGMHEKGLKDERKIEEKRKPEAKKEKGGAEELSKEQVAVKLANREVRQDQKKLLLEIMYMESLMKDQLDVLGKFTNEAASLPPIKWSTFAPTRRYHPDSFFNSLEDTPELYRRTELKKFPMPAGLDKHATPPWKKKKITRADLDRIVTPGRFFIFDITATGLGHDSGGLNGRIQPWNLEWNGTLDSKKKLVWALYDSLADQEVQHRFLTVRNPPGTAPYTPSNSGPARSTSPLQKRNVLYQFEKYRRRGQHRDQESHDSPEISRNLPRKVLDMLVYVIHTESASCLANHVLKFSRFSCQDRDSWVACITLRSWRVDGNGTDGNAQQIDVGSPMEYAVGERSSSQQMNTTTTTEGEESEEECQSHDSVTATSDSSEGDNSTDTPDDDPITLPTNLEDIWKIKSIDRNLKFVLDVSSIVISTNSFGDFSKCTVISELINEQDMNKIVEGAQMIWTGFVHQPQTARCLVFFLVLGKMCQRINEHYARAVNALNPILQDLDIIYKRNEKEWNNNKNAPAEFEFGLWSLDTLSKLQTSLKFSVGSLLQAKVELMAQIQDGPGKRSIGLERMCEGYLREFESSLVQVTSMNAKLERRIELNTRYKEAFSAVLAMRDSRTSLSQNSTVQRLTYLTIGYLPMGLMAAIFAIPSEQHVVLEHMGRRWFVAAILVLSAITFGFAWYIGDFLRHIQNITQFFKQRPNSTKNAEHKKKSFRLRILDKAKQFWEWMWMVFCCCFASRKRNLEGGTSV